MLILFLFLRHKMNNNTRTIVVPSNEITFDKEAYDEDAMSPYISREEFNGIIDKINKIAIVAFFDSKKRKDHSIYKSTNLIILLNFIACILILFFVGFDKMMLIIIILFIFSILSILGQILFIYLNKITHLNDSDRFIRDYIMKYLKEVNKTYVNKLLWRYEPFKKKILINILQ